MVQLQGDPPQQAPRAGGRRQCEWETFIERVLLHLWSLLSTNFYSKMFLGVANCPEKASVLILTHCLVVLVNPFKTNFSLTFSRKTEYIFLSYVSIEELFRK